MYKLLIAVLLFHSAVHADIKHPKPLQDLFAQALVHSPALQIAKATLAIKTSQKNQTQSYQDWDVRLKSELSYSAMLKKQFPRIANKLVGKYPLYQPDIDSLVQADDYAVKSAEFAWQEAKQKLFIDVATGYFNYLSLLAEIIFLEQERESLSATLEQLNQRLELGQQSLSSIATIQAELDGNQANLLEKLEKKWQQQIEIESLIGKQVLLLPMTIKILPMLSQTEASLEQAVQSHPLLQKIQMQIRELDKKIAYQKQKDGVKVDGFVSGVYNNSNGNFYDDMQGISAGITLALPLYIGGRAVANTAGSRAEKQQKQAVYQQQKLMLLSVAKTSHLIYNSSLARIKAISSSIVSYQQVIEAIETGILSGKQNSIDLLKAERLLNKANKTLKLARIKVWQKINQFYWSIGQI